MPKPQNTKRAKPQRSKTRPVSSRPERNFIGVLCGIDDHRRHDELVGLLDDLVAKDPQTLRNFAFVFTGGTYKRVLLGKGVPALAKRHAVEEKTKDFLIEESHVIRLPHHGDGGVIFLAHLVVKRRISILWPFLTPVTPHWHQPDNVALLRLSDYWHINKLLNRYSVDSWFPRESIFDTKRNPQGWPPDPLEVGAVPKAPVRINFVPDDGKRPERSSYLLDIKSAVSKREKIRCLAMIAHDEMKDRMIQFAIDYEQELARKFDLIVTTGTTGARIKEAAPLLKELVSPRKSGPKGGDIEIATEIILGLIETVIFFVDPLHAHPHSDDIRVVFGACMMNPVRMLSNERQARDWMERLPEP